MRHLLIVFFLCSFSASHPIVLLHGVGTTHHANKVLEQLLQRQISHAQVVNMEIGSHDAAQSSFLMSMNAQVEFLCQNLSRNPLLQGGFDLIGVSQGALLGRGFIERCNSPPVRTFVSWVGPQAGIYGLPILEKGCEKYLDPPYCRIFDRMFENLVYTTWMQDRFSFAGYWRNPLKFDSFLRAHSFLADIDNIPPDYVRQWLTNGSSSAEALTGPCLHPQYKTHFSSLDRLILVQSLNDEMLVPPESAHWGFFKTGSTSQLQSLEESDMFKGNWIGLRTLVESGRVIFLNTTASHQDTFSDEFERDFRDGVIPFLLEKK